jgi:hypothetical protein
MFQVCHRTSSQENHISYAVGKLSELFTAVNGNNAIKIYGHSTALNV